MPNGPVIWLPDNLHRWCCREAARLFPLETGGTLMGYWNRENEAAVTAIIPAGPNATHAPYHFEPDQSWQVAAIARHYEASARRETYLGDWHSHPGANGGNLSWTDKGVLRDILKTPEARVTRAIMSIFYGGQDDWRLAVWCAELRHRKIVWPKLLISQAEVQLHGGAAVGS